MPKYSESQLQFAIDEAITTGNVKSSAAKWDIPRSTLQGRLSGAESRSEAQAYNQRLSPVQEKHLADWALTQRALGLPPTHEQLKEFAERIVRNNGDDRPIGKHWIEGFLRRNSSLKTVK